jgi:hypothetical protein
MEKTSKRLSFANVTSALALFVALGGTAFAAATIGANDIKPNAVRAKHIKTGAVKRAEVAKNAINGPRIASGSVASADIANESVGAADIGTGSVGGLEILDASVSAAELGVSPQWVTVPLATGWTTFDGDDTSDYHFGPVQCYKDPFGIVHLRGAAETSDTNPGVIGTLPAACRVIPETLTPTANPYAEFAIVRLDDNGFGIETTSAYVGYDETAASQNSLGEDDGTPFAAGDGLAFDGVAIGAR